MHEVWRRILFFLPAVVYGGIIALRNGLYKRSWILKSQRFDLPMIGIGNLSVGGSGKTPHTMWLADQLQTHKTAVLSRGYGRKTKGFRWVKTNSLTEETGDEPLLIKQHYPRMPVAVCEKRVEGVLTMLAADPDIEVILLDDVMQHRAIAPGLMIMLSSMHRPFYRDCMLPAGNLREWSSGKSRANIIIMTHCPESLSVQEASVIRRRVKPSKNQLLLFSCKHTNVVLPEGCAEVLALSGLADNDQFAQSLRSHAIIRKHFRFPDHHPYSDAELKEILTELERNQIPLVLSEKDYVKIKGRLPKLDAFLLPLKLEISFLFNGDQEMKQALEQFIASYRDKFGDLRPDTLKI